MLYPQRFSTKNNNMITPSGWRLSCCSKQVSHKVLFNELCENNDWQDVWFCVSFEPGSVALHQWIYNPTLADGQEL